MVLGDLQPGETTFGEFTIFAPGIEDWTKLPGLAVRTNQFGNIVVAPFAIERYDKIAYMDILDEIIAELEYMDDHIEGVVNKIGDELTSGILNTDEYYAHLLAAEALHTALTQLRELLM